LQRQLVGCQLFVENVVAGPMSQVGQGFALAGFQFRRARQDDADCCFRAVASKELDCRREVRIVGAE
jgi:hypothetical protein